MACRFTAQLRRDLAKAQHPWVFNIEGQGMYYKLCKSLTAETDRTKVKCGIKKACTTIRKDVLTRHVASAIHKKTLEQGRACQLVKAA